MKYLWSVLKEEKGLCVGVWGRIKTEAVVNPPPLFLKKEGFPSNTGEKNISN